MRPGKWSVDHIHSRTPLQIANFYQYTHLIELDIAAKNNPVLAASLGSDYLIAPDIIICREPEPDATINQNALLVDSELAKQTHLRKTNNKSPILHASISCKWTIRSDRAQNARSEALNLIRNRKGPLPHIAVVIGEPSPTRISSIALGTGDIDCTYHIALYELISTLQELTKQNDKLSDSLELVQMMVDGKRLKDISDLPLDLAV